MMTRETFEDIKGDTRSRKSDKHRQCNDKKKKMTNNDQQNIKQKTKDSALLTACVNFGRTIRSCSTSCISRVALVGRLICKHFSHRNSVFSNQFLMTIMQYWIAESVIIHDSRFQKIFPSRYV